MKLLRYLPFFLMFFFTFNIVVANASLVLWFPFDTDTTPIPDESGEGNNGGLNEATWDPDYNGRYWFDGSDDYIIVSTDDSLNPIAITVTCWAILDSSPPNENHHVLRKNNQYAFGIGQNGRIAGYVYIDGVGWKGTWTGQGVDLRDDEFHHLAYVYDDPYIKFYIDSEYVWQHDTGGGNIRQTTNGLWVGLYESERWKGYLDDIRIYNTVLNQTQIASIYNEGFLLTVLVNYDDNPIENASVSLWEIGGNLQFNELSDEDGEIIANIYSEEYQLVVNKENYQTYNLKFNMTYNKNIEVPLATVEEGITISLNLELLIFAAISGIFMFWGWQNVDLNGLIAATIAFFSWAASGLWFMWTYIDTEKVHFWYFFELFAIISLFLAVRNMLSVMKQAGKKSAWSDF